jgi:hypothetical protein
MECDNALRFESYHKPGGGGIQISMGQWWNNDQQGRHISITHKIMSD